MHSITAVLDEIYRKEQNFKDSEAEWDSQRTGFAYAHVYVVSFLYTYHISDE